MNQNDQKKDLEKDQALYNIRHSAAHLLAQAVLDLYPKTIITIGPVTENGFFYDFLPEKNFKEEDLKIIEKRMRELAKKKFEITGKQVSKQEARELFKNNRFKLELIDQIEDETVGVYTQGDFVDLCKGGHVTTTKEIKHFKLMSISGAYWRADRSGTALQRITGVAFASKQELYDYLKLLEDAKKYDHRKLGKELKLFSFHDQAPGMPFFHHKGLILYRKLVGFTRSLQEGLYQEVRTPEIMNEQSWKTSGHYENYSDIMYFTKTADGETNCVKPMNCPGGILMYKEGLHSYRDLPMRVAEFGVVHRFELSGVRHGLLRVREFTQDDAHIYCTPEQTEQEIIGCLDLIKKVYKPFKFNKISFAVSTRPKKSIGTEAMWQQATDALCRGLERSDTPYVILEGEGAFYGPKIEVRVEDAMGREWQLGTIQVDFNLPERFEIEYIDTDQSRKTPVMIHRAIMGSIERFMGIILEHFKGVFPFWLAPEQVRVLTITEKQDAYAQDIFKKLRARNIRVECDSSGDQISAQIRRAQLEKIPVMLVLGAKEQENNTVTIRYVDGKQEFGLTLDMVYEKLDSLNSIE